MRLARQSAFSVFLRKCLKIGQDRASAVAASWEQVHGVGYVDPNQWRLYSVSQSHAR